MAATCEVNPLIIQDHLLLGVDSLPSLFKEHYAIQILFKG